MNADERRAHICDRELSAARRDLHKVRRRRSERMLLLVLVLGPMFAYVTYELGRSLFYMQRVLAFAKTIEAMPAAEVKKSVGRYAQDLHNSNPLIRNGAMIAMRIATSWKLGTDPVEWGQWWEKQEPFWEYQRPTTNAAPATTTDWRKQIPPGLVPAARQP